MPMDVLLKEIGERVRFFRVLRDIIQTDLAALVDLDERTIQRIENGEEPTCIRTLEKIADVLEIDVDMIIEASTRPLPPMTE